MYWQCAVPDAPKIWHLIHEDLHLHQPCIGVPRRPVGYHSSKGNQGSGLTSELLREGAREENQLTFKSGQYTENPIYVFPLSTVVSGTNPGTQIIVITSAVIFLQYGAKLAKLVHWVPSSTGHLNLSIKQQADGLSGKLSHHNTWLVSDTAWASEVPAPVF